MCHYFPFLKIRLYKIEILSEFLISIGYRYGCNCMKITYVLYFLESSRSKLVIQTQSMNVLKKFINTSEVDISVEWSITKIEYAFTTL